MSALRQELSDSEEEEEVCSSSISSFVPCGVPVDNVVTCVGNECHTTRGVMHPPRVILASYSSDVDGLIAGGKRGNLLIKNPMSTIGPTELISFRSTYRIPDNVKLHAPHKFERVDSNLPGWICMYIFPFKFGLRLPLPRLVEEYCAFHILCPSQLIPNTWRVLLAVEVLAEKYGLVASLRDIFFCFYSKEHPLEKGRYNLVCRKSERNLITGLKDGDKRWKNRYLFLLFENLGLRVDSPIPSYWTSGCRIKVLADHFGSRGTPEVAGVILSLSIKERYWENVLSESSLRKSSLWRQVPVPPEGIPYPSSRAVALTLLIRRSLELLGYHLSILPELTPAEQLFADHIMSGPGKVAPLAGDNALEELLLPTDPTRGSVGGKKKRVVVENTQDTGDISLVFPSSSCSSEMAPIFEEVDKLLFPEDHDRMDQEALSQIETLRGENEALQVQNAELEDRRAVAALESEIQVHGQMAKDFLAGQWNSSKYIQDYEALFAIGNPQEEEEEDNEDALDASVGGMSVGETPDMAED
ncbi:hypothetical protein TorRG33x02_267800 [Trema orientale]|uniref:Transposase (Putative), gypsy type n=1 Tax=Trema orientale TaxID=63057 RepID=A0A2P5CZF5_TREOI|nr:hypothetical protein TorRG33x02_267800 [Trema orientale]